jgi:hypothetical protein
MGQQGFMCPLVGRAAVTTAKGELMFWRIIGRLACVVVVSFSQATAGVLAHELGHSYFEDEMAEGRRIQDAFAMRVVELKCDGVAILSLRLLGRDPTGYVRGLRRLRLITKRKGLSDVILQSHPKLVDRMKFSQSLIKSLK